MKNSVGEKITLREGIYSVIDINQLWVVVSATVAF